MVEVDPDTGLVRVRRCVAVDDCGRVVNPALAAAQAHGGIAQGIGGALWERCIYDGGGQLVTATLMDYAVPTAAALPPMEVDHLESRAPGGPRRRCPAAGRRRILSDGRPTGSTG